MMNDPETEHISLSISPMTRLSMVFKEEMERDTDGLLLGLKDKYIERLSQAQHRRDGIFRTMFMIDAILAFLITGQDFKIPVLDVRAIDIPAVIEVATLGSAITLVFSVVNFITWASYDAIVRQFGNFNAGIVSSSQEKAGKHTIDPDFLNAAESHVELALKLLGPKFNILGPDYYEPGRIFKAYSGLVFSLIGLLFLLFPVVHWLLVGLSLYATYLAHGLGFFTGLYFLVVIVLNLLAIIIWVGAYRDFKFIAYFDRAPWRN